MWRVTRLAANAANNMQIDAGLLVNNFDITNPGKPADADIVCATTGDFSIRAVPTTEDFFADVNGAPANTKQGKRITGWECTLSVGCLEITEDTLVLALGAADIGTDGGVHPRSTYALTDFKTLAWLGDFADDTKLLAVVMDNVASTGGLSLTTTKNGKGNLALDLMAHSDYNDPDRVPMSYYLLEKVDEDAPTYSYSAVDPVGNENPKIEGWCVLAGDTYRATSDTAVDANKTYFERTAD